MTSPLRARSISSASSSGRPSTVNRTSYTATLRLVPVAQAPPYNRGVTRTPPPGTGGRVFRRAPGANPLVAVRAEGSTLWDSAGRAYLDAAGGAIVVNVGHGRASVAAAMAEQAGRLAYAHGSTFTTEPLEAYAAEVGARLPVDDPAIYPVSGGSEAMETALKLVRAYHLARGDPGRWMVAELERAIEAADPDTVAAFVGEPIVGATLGGAVPPDGYWPRVAEVCRRHGILLVADEVMTGFGRTGRWFGMDHWKVRPDILVAAKGATSGYWPLGFVAASGEIHDAVTSAGPFVHGFTYSHNPVGAAVAREVLRILETEELIGASASKGARLRGLLEDGIGDQPAVGDIRGAGLLVGIELVADRTTRRPFPRAARVTEAVVGAARERGLIVYSSTGCADGVDGDLIVLGPPFVVTDDELVRIADTLDASVAEAVAGVPTLAV